MDACNLPRLNYGEIENVNSLVTRKKTEAVKVCHRVKAQGLMTPLKASIKHLKD